MIEISRRTRTVNEEGAQYEKEHVSVLPTERCEMVEMTLEELAKAKRSILEYRSMLDCALTNIDVIVDDILNRSTAIDSAKAKEIERKVLGREIPWSIWWRTNAYRNETRAREFNPPRYMELTDEDDEDDAEEE